MQQNSTSEVIAQALLAPATAPHDAEDHIILDPQSKRAVGDRIRHARINAKMKQFDVAAKIGVSRAAVSNWELGQGIRNKSLFIFAQVVGVSPQWLLTGEKMYENEGPVIYVPEELEMLMSHAFVWMGQKEAQAQELARGILKAAERPRSDGLAPPDPALMKKLAQFLVRMYAT